MGTDYWKDYILSPKQHLVAVKRWTIVPQDSSKWEPETFQWNEETGPFEIPTREGMCTFVDFGQKVTGHLVLQCEEQSQFDLDIESGPVLDLVIFKDKLNYHSEAGYWTDPKYRALRFAKFTSKTMAGKKLKASVEFSAYPASYEGHFYCDDNLLNKIWYTGAYTTQLCIQPHEFSGTYNEVLPRKFGDFASNFRSKYSRYVIWDGPRRDREVWVGDMWPELHTAIYAFNAIDAVKASLEVGAVQQEEDGLIPGSGLTRQPFFEYACWWINLVDRLYLLTGDITFVHDMEETILRLLQWLQNQLRENDGYMPVSHRHTWAWTLMRRGIVTGSQCVAHGALKAGARLLELLGRPHLISSINDDADTLGQKIRTDLWNAKDGVFRDSLAPPDGVKRISCDSNALAVLFGIADKTQADQALAYLRNHLWGPYGTATLVPPEPEEKWNWAHNHNVWPFVVGLELEARFEHGDFDGAMELLKTCWGNMINHQAETFWEMVDGKDGGFVTHRPVADTGMDGDTWDSYCHGWSAGVSAMMQSDLLGVQPIAPAFQRFRVKPRLCALNTASGAVPTPFGPINLQLEQRNNDIQGTITVPPGTTAELELTPGKLQTLASGTHSIKS